MIQLKYSLIMAILVAASVANANEMGGQKIGLTDYNFAKGNPIRFVENGYTVLMIESATKVGTGIKDGVAGPKNLFSDWKEVNGAAEWVVRSERGHHCQLYGVLNSYAAWNLTIGTNNFQGNEMPQGRMALYPYGLARVRFGEVFIDKGDNRINLCLAGTNVAKFKSIEIISDEASVELASEAKRMRSSAAWLAQAKYGVMVQFGSWGYPVHGERLPWVQLFEQFNVDAFSRMVADDMGAGWVIWSLTWRGSRFAMPLKSVDALAPDHTTKHDFIDKLATALNQRGVKLMLYYHPGYEDKEFWYPNWTPEGRSNRSLFFKNWADIMTEIGTRYGTNLAGWFYDDGCVYYPAPFAMLAKAAKAGNPNRIVSYNNWALPNYTEFQDVEFGEGHRSAEVKPEDGGVLKVGPAAGQYAHGMFCVDGPDWGIWKPETKIKVNASTESIVKTVKEGVAKGVPLSLNFLMYEDGSISPETLQTMKAVKAAIRGN